MVKINSQYVSNERAGIAFPKIQVSVYCIWVVEIVGKNIFIRLLSFLLISIAHIVDKDNIENKL